MNRIVATLRVAHALSLAPCALLLLGGLSPSVFAQATVEVVASDLAAPLGVDVDPSGRVWVAEAGTGEGDGRVSVFADGTLSPFMEGFPSEGSPQQVDGLSHLRYAEGRLWIAGGAGPTPAVDLWSVDPSGFTPGDPPLSPADAEASFSIGTWVLGQGFAETNVFDVSEGFDGDLLIADAAANSIIRLDPDTSTPSVFVTFDSIPTGGTPPAAEPVPTSVLFDGDHFFSSTLTGFPFAEGIARVMRVEADGSASIHHDGLTLLTDLARDPRDGRLVALEFARRDPAQGFLPGTGRVVKLLDGGATEVIADELNLVTSLSYAPDGALYVTSLFGQLLRISSPSTSTEGGATPLRSTLRGAYPNPLVSEATLLFDLAERAQVRLTVHDVLGREVAVVTERAYGAGEHAVTLDARALPAGLYVARLVTGDRAFALKLVKAH